MTDSHGDCSKSRRRQERRNTPVGRRPISLCHVLALAHVQHGYINCNIHSHSDTISLSTIIQPQTVGWNIYSNTVNWNMYTLSAGTSTHCQLEHVHTVSWNIYTLSAGTCIHCQLEHLPTVSWNTYTLADGA